MTLRDLQAEWDALAASDPTPMPIARPTHAGRIGGGLLVALVLIFIWSLA